MQILHALATAGLVGNIVKQNASISGADGTHRVSFDRVVEVMKRTGHDIPSLYKETSEGGLAKGFEAL